MKSMTRIMAILLILLLATGCSNDEGSTKGIDKGNNVDSVLNEQIDKADAEKDSDNFEQETSPESESILNEPETIHDPESILNEQNISIEENANTSSDVDYDLTNMNSDMVYATVYQMMVDPDTYIGKTFRMSGQYYGTYYEPTSQYYHYCIIQDALACCAQGMEFVWEDGSHIYPDEYPEESTNVVVEGTFETYREDGDDSLYCRLKDSTMEVANEQ